MRRAEAADRAPQAGRFPLAEIQSTIYCNATNRTDAALVAVGALSERDNRPWIMSERRIIRNISIPDLMRYRLPVPGVLSILHRVSGALMFVLLPLSLWLFELSLRSELSYRQLKIFVGGGFVKVVLAALAWALVHLADGGEKSAVTSADAQSAARYEWGQLFADAAVPIG